MNNEFKNKIKKRLYEKLSDISSNLLFEGISPKWYKFPHIINPLEHGQPQWEVLEHWLRGEAMELGQLRGMEKYYVNLSKDLENVSIRFGLGLIEIGEIATLQNGRMVAFERNSGRWYGIAQKGTGKWERIPAYTKPDGTFVPATTVEKVDIFLNYELPKDWQPGDPLRGYTEINPPDDGNNAIRSIIPGIIGGGLQYREGDPHPEHNINPYNTEYDIPYREA